MYHRAGPPDRLILFYYKCLKILSEKIKQHGNNAHHKQNVKKYIKAFKELYIPAFGKEKDLG
ncbi:hypothetical protein BH23BAC2_BH23BAC2_06590 [soil metagenome]